MSVFASQSTIRSTVSRVMISLRFGPAFTWQCTQVRLQSLPMLTCKISGRLRRSESERSASLWANRFIVNQRQLRLSRQQRNSYHFVVAACTAKRYTSGSLSILFYEKVQCRIYRHVRPCVRWNRRNCHQRGAITHVGISLTFGLIVLVMIYTVGDVSGAHLNPAVSLGFFA